MYKVKLVLFVNAEGEKKTLVEKKVEQNGPGKWKYLRIHSYLQVELIITCVPLIYPELIVFTWAS